MKKQLACLIALVLMSAVCNAREIVALSEGWTACVSVSAAVRPPVDGGGKRPWKMFDRRVGLFVHWGVYSVLGYHEQARWRLGMSRAEYKKAVSGFTAERFSAEGFVDAAESLGAEYIVITTKHHDGFCMWDTKTTDFSVMNSPVGRDLIREVADACRRRGMKLGFYFSNPDWNHPNGYNPLSTHQTPPEPGDKSDMDVFKQFVKAQVTELLSNYGEICCFFWDIPTKIDAPEMNALVRKLQPGIMIDDRGWGRGGDYSTPERGIPAGTAFVRPTEACDSVGARSWGYRVNEDYRTVGYCTRSIDHILSMGGNFLLNIGPKADGSIPREALELLSKTGAWYRRVRESYRGVTTEPWLANGDGVFVTRRGSTVYVHCPRGLNQSGLDLSPLDVLPSKATLLNDGTEVEAELALMPNRWQRGKRTLHLKGIAADRYVNESVVVRLDFPEEPTVELVRVDTLYSRKDHSEIPEKTCVRMLRTKDAVKLVFEFDGEYGIVDRKAHEKALGQEAYAEERGGEFVLGGEDESLHGVFGISGRLWTNGRDNFKTGSVMADGCWTYTVEIPLRCIPRAVGDSGAFFANFHRKTARGFYQWTDNSATSTAKARGCHLVRLEPRKKLAAVFENSMDERHSFRSCWERDAPRIVFEPSGGVSGGGFRMVNTNAAEDVHFHNGRGSGRKDCFVELPSLSMPVVSSIKVKGRGRFRFGFMPWTLERTPLYPNEVPYREYKVDSPDRWITLQDGYLPRPDRLYAERTACMLPSIWLEPGADITIDDLRVEVVGDIVCEDPSLVKGAFPGGVAGTRVPMAAATPVMRGAFLADEWKCAAARGGALMLRDSRMLYIAACTDGGALSLALKTPDDKPFPIAVAVDGTVATSSKSPVYSYVNHAPDGKLVYRLAIPLSMVSPE